MRPRYLLGTRSWQISKMPSSHEPLVSCIPSDDMRFEPISQQAVWDSVSNDPADHITGSLADHIMGSDHTTAAPDLESTLRGSPDLESTLVCRCRPRVRRPWVRPPKYKEIWFFDLNDNFHIHSFTPPTIQTFAGSDEGIFCSYNFNFQMTKQEENWKIAVTAIEYRREYQLEYPI